MADKIIHSFQQRRQLAQTFEQMAETEGEDALLESVRALVDEYPADLLISTLVRHLDTTSSQLRGGLGHLAALLPGEEVGAALRSAAANRQLSAQTRLTAALIADRFVGRPVPPALLQDLSNANDVAFQSLLEAIEEGRRNRHVLLEYVAQMRQLGQEIAFMVIDMLDRLPPEDRPALLRLIAQDTRLPVAQRAIDRLIRLAEDTAIQPAQAALHTLQFTLPPRLADVVERTNRKLRFAGAGYVPPVAEGWRGLISPADMGGNQTIWCLHGPEAGKPGILLGLVVNPRAGILQAFGSESVAPEHLPQPQPVGKMTLVKTDSGEDSVLLEAPFDFCRWRIQVALDAHWKNEARREQMGEYQLYNDLIWQFAPPVADDALRHFFRVPDTAQPPVDIPVEQASTTKDAAQQKAARIEELDTRAAHLLQHPAMAHWQVQNRMLQQLLRLARPTAESPANDLAAPELISLVLGELAARPETKQIIEAMAGGLQAQAAWLFIAGDSESAEHALALAHALPDLSPVENPLLARMIAASITLNT